MFNDQNKFREKSQSIVGVTEISMPNLFLLGKENKFKMESAAKTGRQT
jgi:hypothetical protein